MFFIKKNPYNVRQSILISLMVIILLIFGYYFNNIYHTVNVMNESEAKVVNPDIGGGKILFYSTSGAYIDAANVGNLPDMVKFIDNNTVIVANEGEPENNYQSDPKGSISIIDLSEDNTVLEVVTLGFGNQKLKGDVRIKSGSSRAEDIEPEYIAVNTTGTKAWVSLQENNAIAIVDISSKSISAINGLGKREWKKQKVDIANDGIANPKLNTPNGIFALYQPDSIVSYNVNGKDYIVTANEGDDRNYGDYKDLSRVDKLEDKNGSLLSENLQNVLLNSDMKKLRVLTDLGQDIDGIYQELYMTGTRSFSIWDENAQLVFDSGSEIEELLAKSYSSYFNVRIDSTNNVVDIARLDKDGILYSMVGDTAYFWDEVDAQSLKKGAEPEALAIEQIGDKFFAYIGLEKQGGFFVYDITVPNDAKMVEYNNTIDYTALPIDAGDIGPEGMVTFVQNKKHFLSIANEVSSTISIYELLANGVAIKKDSISIGTFGSGAAEIIDYDPDSKQLFVTNGELKRIEIIDASTPTHLSITGHINFSDYADHLQSLSVRNGLVAIAVARK